MMLKLLKTVRWYGIFGTYPIACFILFFFSCSTRESSTVYSPDGNIMARLRTDGRDGHDKLVYDVFFEGRIILEDCPLGFELSDGTRLETSFTIVDIEDETVDETYAMPYGKSTRIRSVSKRQTICLEDRDGNRLNVQFNVFDDGIGFRYFFPDQKIYGDFGIKKEITGFNFAGDPVYWGLHLDSFTTSYESVYTQGNISDIQGQTILGLPVLFRLEGDVWTAITEAALCDYAGMYLSPDTADASLLVAELAPGKDGSGLPVKTNGPRFTPWRVIMIADDPGRLVESNLVLNLNDPAYLDFSWVRPGIALDDWTCDQTVKGTGWEGAMDTRTMKHFIDFCADYGLDYMSIDAGWYGLNWSDTTLDLTKPIPEIDIPYLVEYAENKGVGIFLWTLSTVLKKQIDEAIPLFKQWGIKGFNVDFFNSDDQETVNEINSIIKKAAENQMMVELHGIYKPTGISRTYPNLLAHEAVLGLEYYKWDSIPTPEHNCIIPFTRMLAGPMDYIVVGFTNRTRKDFRIVWDEFNCLGTRCHQLAQLILFETGFQVLGDYPDNYRNSIGSDLFRSVTVAWDETRVLHARVGDYVSIARRKGAEWFIGSITDWTPRVLEIPLDFLEGEQYAAEMYEDGPDADRFPDHAGHSTFRIFKNDTLKIKMAPGGGNVVKLTPAEPVEGNP